MAREATPQKKQLMLERSIPSLIPSMALPPIIAQLITKIYNLVDTYFVSTIGTAATAAVGINGSLEHIITLIGSLIGAGACSYIARLLGEKRNQDADRVLSTAFFSGVGLGVLFAVFGYIFVTPLIRLLNSNAASELYAVQYATYVLLAAPFMIGSFILNMCLRSEGSATYAMIGIAAGGILNCFLDPLFINTFGLGVSGASIATAISKLVSFCVLIIPYVRKKCSVRISLQYIRFVWNDIKEVLGIGSTLFFRSACNIVSAVLINRIAGSFSTAALASVSVANRIMEFPFAIILGFSQGCQPIVGFNWGASQRKRVREILRLGTIVAVVGSAVMAAVLFLTAGPVLHLFNKEEDAEVLRLGLLCIQLQCLSLPFHGFDTVINMFYSGIGRARIAMLMSTARQGYCFLPVVLTIPFLFGAEGVTACQAIADCLTLAVSLPLGIKAFRMTREMADAGLAKG